MLEAPQRANRTQRRSCRFSLFLLGLLSLEGMLVKSVCAGAEKPPRLALLVGISRYSQKVAENRKAWPELHTREEISELRKVLISRHEFKPRDIMVLENEQASRKAIRDGLQYLLSRARPGAVFFFHFAGHGQQLLDKDGDEYDGLDESLVPADARDQSAASGAETNIIDDEIAVWLSQLADRMRGANRKVDGSIVLSFDSCFSGTMTRGDLVERGRGWDPVADEPPAPRRQERSAGAPQHRTPTLDLEPDDYTLLTASRSNQTAKERDGIGVYSRALIAALTQLSRDVSYRTLMYKVSVGVRQSVSNQNPDLEGAADRVLFGSGLAKASAPFLSVLNVDGDKVEIPEGELHFVTPRSVYALHRAGSAPIGASTLLAEAEVTWVKPFTSWLRLRPGTQKVRTEDLRSARVIEKERCYRRAPLRVLCQHESSGPCTSPALLETLQPLQQSQLITLEAGNPGGTAHQVKIVDHTTQVDLFHAESGTRFASIPNTPGDPNAFEGLSSWLRAEWRWHRLFNLRGQSDAVQVSLRLLPVRAKRNANGLVDESPEPLAKQAEASLRLAEGSLYLLEIHNTSPTPVWVTVLELGPDGQIHPLFPKPGQRGDGYIAPTPTPLRVSRGYIFEATAPLGGWTLKIIATRQWVDFSTLAQQALTPGFAGSRAQTAGREAAVHPLGELLLEALSGNRLRGGGRIPLDAWSVSEALLEVEAPRAEASPPDPRIGISSPGP